MQSKVVPLIPVIPMSTLLSRMVPRPTIPPIRVNVDANTLEEVLDAERTIQLALRGRKNFVDAVGDCFYRRQRIERWIASHPGRELLWSEQQKTLCMLDGRRECFRGGHIMTAVYSDNIRLVREDRTSLAWYRIEGVRSRWANRREDWCFTPVILTGVKPVERPRRLMLCSTLDMWNSL